MGRVTKIRTNTVNHNDINSRKLVISVDGYVGVNMDHLPVY